MIRGAAEIPVSAHKLKETKCFCFYFLGAGGVGRVSCPRLEGLFCLIFFFLKFQIEAGEMVQWTRAVLRT